MGNTASVEEGRRTTHKLAKPKVGNHETNTLLSPIGLPDPRRRYSASRTTSLPYGTTPAPSPLFPGPDSTMGSPPEDDKNEQGERKPRSRSISRTATSLFRSRSSQAIQDSRARQNSLGVQTPSQSARPSRANSMVVGGSEPHYTQPNVAVWNTPVRPSAGSRRTSVTYDLNSYEAKRLLNLVEEPAHEKNSVASESKVQAVPAARRNSVQSPVGDKTVTTTISRVSSDISLYAPMRRKSLIATPGVATRAPAPAVPKIPKIPRRSDARFSLPSTPARRDSLDSIAVGMLSIPPPSINTGSMPRAVTPCEEDYGHIGAFKIGSLRITNGSPAISPAVETPMEMLPSLRGRIERNDYFAAGQGKPSENAPTLRLVTTDNKRSGERSQFLSPSTIAEQGHRGNAPPTVSQYLPEVRPSPVDMGNRSEPDVFGLLTTSKHTALEDDLFEDGPAEYSQSEVLDIRVDLSAKSLPPRPRLISEGRNPREMMRSDSGVVATPILEELPQGTLAKSDSGYSSNVSLRSFSTRPSLAEKDCSVPDTDFPPQTPIKETLPAVYESPADSHKSSPKTANPEKEVHLPPAVPDKQLAIKDIGSKDLSGSVPRGSEAAQRGRVSEEHGNSSQGVESKSSSTSHESGQSVMTPASAPTIQLGSDESNDTRKPGKLGRLLQSARKPLTSQTGQASEKASTPSRPKAKLNERVGSFTLSMKRLGLKTENSKVTSEPTTNNQSEPEHDKAPPVPKIPRIVADAEAKSVSDASFWSADVSLSSGPKGIISNRTAIARKPLPIRKNSFETSQVEVKTGKNGYTYPELQHLKLGFEEVTISVTHTGSSSPEDTLTEHMRRTRSPPVSMKTRNMSSSQKRPTPLELSTPPTAVQSPGTTSLARRPSREDIHSYPSVKPSVSRKSSRDNVHSYPPAQPVYETLDRCITNPSHTNVNRQCFESIKANGREHRLPNWEVQTDHGTPTQRSFVNNSRVASPVDQAHHRNTKSPELQLSVQLHKPVRPSAPRHQSSYDGYSYEQIQAAAEAAAQNFHNESLYQDNGPFPSWQRSDGQACVADPWSGQSQPQTLDQQARFPPYIPRGHTRTNSLGSHGAKAPFRVLHSYNSPAYKNAPIWG